MSGKEEITTEALRMLAEKLDDVAELLKGAGESIEAGEVGGSSFTKYGIDMMLAYPSAHSFGVRDAERKERHIDTIQERLRSTAKTWDAAEAANTVTTGGGH